MTNNLYDITILDVSNINNIDSLSIFNNNLLEIWYFDLDSHPKDYLIEDFLDVFHPSRNLRKFNLYKKILDKLKLNITINNKSSEEYCHHLHMFNQEGYIIGNIIEINYNEIIYDNFNYDYEPMINQIYEAINNNAGYSNRCFYLYLSDDEKQYDSLNINKFTTFRLKNLRL